MANDYSVNPYSVSGQVDYQKITKEFGLTTINDSQIEKMTVGKESHFLLRRKIFFVQRNLDFWLDSARKKMPVALYTGRGPGGSTHLGHLIPWIFTKWIADNFKCPLYFQMTDDEKFMFKDELSRKQTLEFAYENSLDLIALGFQSNRTKILIDTKDANKLYPIAIEVAKKITVSTIKSAFGFTDSTNIGSMFFTSMQSAPCILPTIIAREEGTIDSNEFVPVLIPHAVDQDPHFRITRDVIEKIGYLKPSSVQCKFIPSLNGGMKMSASDPQSSIYTTDTASQVKKKIAGAFTGGRATAEEQRKFGGNPNICSVCKYLEYFFEPDDIKLQERLDAYRKGLILDGENKQYLYGLVEKFLSEHQKKRMEAKNKLNDFLYLN